MDMVETSVLIMRGRKEKRKRRECDMHRCTFKDVPLIWMLWFSSISMCFFGLHFSCFSKGMEM